MPSVNEPAWPVPVPVAQGGTGSRATSGAQAIAFMDAMMRTWWASLPTSAGPSGSFWLNAGVLTRVP